MHLRKGRAIFLSFMTKLGEAGDRFGEYWCDDCADLLCASRLNKLLKTKNTPQLPKFRSVCSIYENRRKNKVAKVEHILSLNLSGCEDC